MPPTPATSAHCISGHLTNIASRNAYARLRIGAGTPSPPPSDSLLDPDRFCARHKAGLPAQPTRGLKDVSSETASQAQYLAISDALKELSGSAFESHGHPAVLLDRVTGTSTLVWGWWTEEAPQLPCLLWFREPGWSAAVVRADMFDGEGYEREFWAHRIRLLDFALANALGPFPALEDLELEVTTAAGFGLGTRDAETKRALHWGIRHLRAACARTAGLADGDRSLRCGAPPDGGVIDAELARHALVPTLTKSGAGFGRVP